MIRRLLDPLFSSQAWTDGVGELMQRLVRAAYGPFPPLRDLLHGTWLGHPVHPMLTDVPIGALVAAFLLDLAGQGPAATWLVAIGIVTMLAAALAGFADYLDLTGNARRYGTLHALAMILSLLFYVLSLGERLWWPLWLPSAQIWLGGVGLVLLLVGAYLGGDLVFDFGSQVDRHAWRAGGTKWQALDVTEVPEGQLTKAKAGAQTLVVVRRGDRLYALHDTCAHQGCSLAGGRLVDGGARIECPCHGSRFELADGSVSRGPAVFPQPVYELRSADGRIEARRRS